MPVLEGAQGRGRHPIREEAGSLESFFEPKPLAIIGASATPKTRSVAVITNAGGAGIIAADALEESGFIIPRFSDGLIAKFSEYKAKKLLLPVQSDFNPIDLSAEATSDMFALVIATILDDPAIGGLVLITLHHAPTILDAVDKIAEAIPEYGKPVMICDMGATEMAQTRWPAYGKQGVRSFELPERAARALWVLSRYGTYLQGHGIARSS